MFGYASNETDELMPLPIMLAHRLAQRLAEVRKADVLPYLRPDGKTQVTVRYEVDEHGRQRPVEIERVLISTQHRDGPRHRDADQAGLIEHVLEPILPKELYDARRARARPRLRLLQPDRQVRGRRPDGRHRADGPQDHRRHVRRRGARTAAAPSRARIRRRSTARPRTRRATSRRTSSRRAWPSAARSRSRTRSASRIRSRSSSTRSAPRRSRSPRIEELVREHFDLRPAAILRDLDLRRPIYAKTAAYGHFGRERRRLHLGAHRQGGRAPRRPRGSPHARRLSRSRDGSDEQPGGGLLEIARSPTCSIATVN